MNTKSPAKGSQIGSNTKPETTATATSNLPDQFVENSSEMAPTLEHSPAGVLPEVGPFAPLTSDDIAELKAANNTDEQIMAIAASLRKKTRKKERELPDLGRVIANKKDWLLEQSGGKPLFSSHLTCELICGAGFYPRPLRANAFGDKMGGHDLQLPEVKVGSVLYRDVNYIGSPQAEKDTRQAKLDSLLKAGKYAVLRGMIAEMRETSEPSETDGTVG